MSIFHSVYIHVVIDTQATDTPAEIKSKLVYRDHDELDTGMQKVQPLPFLGNYIN